MVDYLMRLSRLEVWWRDHYAWFESQGYALRARYHPKWTPSWTRPELSRSMDDGQKFMRHTICSATRLSDRTTVMMKQVRTNLGLPEEEIATMLGTGLLGQDPKNRCIPILEVLRVPSEPIVILVMPMLRAFDNPAWDTVGEVVDCIRQIFEGIQFMHQHLVAHRDPTAYNIMMDGSMYPHSFHPIKHSKRPDFKGSAPHYTRTQRPPRYYLIDFGLSVVYDPAYGPPRFVPVMAADKSAPECQTDDHAYDPFPTDVYYLGHWIELHFLEKLKGLDFLHELSRDMMAHDPSSRPTIDDVVRRFNAIITSLSTARLRSRPTPRDENAIVGAFRLLGHWKRRAVFTVKRTPALPIPPCLSP